MTTAYAYKRVSTKEQGEEGFSLSAQDVALIEYCKKNNIHLKGMFSDDCTGTNFDRPGFTDLLKANTKDKADLILFTKWSRFSRNTGASYQMISRLKKQGTSVQAIEEKINLDIPQEQLMLAIQLVLPQIDNDIRRDTTMKGTIEARAQGRYTGMAPTGYTNARDQYKKPVILPDPVKAPMVQKAFNLIANGTTQNEARAILRQDGLKLARSHFHSLLRSEIYIGNVIVPAYKSEPQRTVKGIHEAIIDEATFWKVQDMLRGRKRIKRYIKTAEEFPLRGLLYCHHDHKMTGSCSHGHGGNYHYYHCPNELACERHQAKAVNDSFESMLSGVAIAQPIAEIVVSTLEHRLRPDPTDRKAIQNRIAAQENSINLLIDRYVQGHINHDDYTRTRVRYESEKATISEQLELLNLTGSELTLELDEAMKMLTNLSVFYQNARPEAKPKVAGSIIKGKLYYQDNKCRTSAFNPLVELTRNIGAGFRGTDKKRTPDFSPDVLPCSGDSTTSRTFLPKAPQIIAGIRELSEAYKMLRA